MTTFSGLRPSRVVCHAEELMTRVLWALKTVQIEGFTPQPPTPLNRQPYWAEFQNLYAYNRFNCRFRLIWLQKALYLLTSLTRLSDT